MDVQIYIKKVLIMSSLLYACYKLITNLSFGSWSKLLLKCKQIIIEVTNINKAMFTLLKKMLLTLLNSSVNICRVDFYH